MADIDFTAGRILTQTDVDYISALQRVVETVEDTEVPNRDVLDRIDALDQAAVAAQEATPADLRTLTLPRVDWSTLFATIRLVGDDATPTPDPNRWRIASLIGQLAGHRKGA